MYYLGKGVVAGQLLYLFTCGYCSAIEPSRDPAGPSQCSICSPERNVPILVGPIYKERRRVFERDTEG